MFISGPEPSAILRAPAMAASVALASHSSRVSMKSSPMTLSRSDRAGISAAGRRRTWRAARRPAPPPVRGRACGMRHQSAHCGRAIAFAGAGADVTGAAPAFGLLNKSRSICSGWRHACRSGVITSWIVFFAGYVLAAVAHQYEQRNAADRGPAKTPCARPAPPRFCRLGRMPFADFHDGLERSQRDLPSISMSRLGAGQREQLPELPPFVGALIDNNKFAVEPFGVAVGGTPQPTAIARTAGDGS